ncbi:LuxR C-terminal-related transcriptional regulator [Pseudomonas boanensis]|uniref:helix-turn-helix transcriptional regulator n=1 Tax=Metapseudomonas boanensis TaxID=2822138 RepID=UPI0035D4E6EC
MDNDFGLQCLLAFSRVVPASFLAFYQVDSRLQARDFRLLRMDARTHRDYLCHYREFDPLQPALCVDSGRPVLPLHDAMTRQPREQRQVYQGFLQRHGICDVVEVIARDQGRPVAGVSLLRTVELGRFATRELDCLQGLQGLLELAARHAPGARETVANPLANLTAREQEIALLLREGQTNKDLARQLDLSLATVKTHLIHLFRKTGARSRTELVRRLFP